MSVATLPPNETTRLGTDRAARLFSAFLGAALVGGALLLLGLILDHTQALFSYLTAFIFVVSLGLGALFWVMLHHLTGAGWSVVVRRVMENLSTFLIFGGVLILPVLFGMSSLYEWVTTDPQQDKILAGKRGFLNVPFFVLRAIIYFSVWAWVAWRFSTLSAQQDDTTDTEPTRKMQRLSPVGMILLGFTAAFAGIDWVMTLEYQWYSTMFGVYFWAGAILGSMALATLIIVSLRHAGILAHTITEEHLHDLGKLMFGFVIFWAYVTFAQYFLTWYADIPEETVWYSHRRWTVKQGFDVLDTWHYVGIAIVFGHVIVPFLVLLPRSSKRNPAILGFIATWLLAFRYIELHYEITPVLHKDHAVYHWLDLAALLAVVGVGGIIVLRAFRSRPLVPVGDPRLAESLKFENM